MPIEALFPDPNVRALASAAGAGELHQVDELLARGVDVNARGALNATPLFWALRDLSGFRHLLEAGADPNVVFQDGGSVMHWAAGASAPEFLQEALGHGGDPNLVTGSSMKTPLFYALRSGPRNVELLLDAGANIDHTNANGDSAVMVAAALGRFDLTYLLLSRGASYELRNRSGASLADRIAVKRNVMDPNHELGQWMNKVIEWLRDRGIVVSALGNGPVLSIAEESGDISKNFCRNLGKHLAKVKMPAVRRSGSGRLVELPGGGEAPGTSLTGRASVPPLPALPAVHGLSKG